MTNQASEQDRQKEAEIEIPLSSQLNANDLEEGRLIVVAWQRSSGIRLFADQQGWKLERLIAAALTDKGVEVRKAAVAEVWDKAIEILRSGLCAPYAEGDCIHCDNRMVDVNNLKAARDGGK